MSGRAQLLGVFATLAVLSTLSTSSSAGAEVLSPWWHLSSVARPGDLSVDAESFQELAVTAVNVGDGVVDTSGSPAMLTDVLPEHVRAQSVELGSTISATSNNLALGKECNIGGSGTVVTCVFNEGSLPPFSQVEVLIGVVVEAGASTGEVNRVSISGGGAPRTEAGHPITVGGSSTPFGVEDYEPVLEEAGGRVDTQAGSHPFQFTTTLDLNQKMVFNSSAGRLVPTPAGLTKDVVVKLPPGLIGNPTAYPQCSLAQFSTYPQGATAPNDCALDTVVGVVALTVNEPGTLGGTLGTQTFARPIYNLAPNPGEPARFGFAVESVPTFLDTSVRTGEDYGVTVHVENVPQAIGFLNNTVTFWGVPGDTRHDNSRGTNCLEQAEGYTGERAGPCEPTEQSNPAPFLTTPTSCPGEALSNTVEVDSWSHPGEYVRPGPDPSVPEPGMGGCGLLAFHGEIGVTPDGQAASTPSGLDVDVHVPQEGQLTAEGLAQSNIRNIKVVLPEGLALNPSAADGLQACSLAQIGFTGVDPLTGADRFTSTEPSCPNASKIANVTIKTPLLPNPLTGFVYLAAPQNFAFPSNPLENPFASLVAMYLVAQDPVSGTLVKLPGSVSLSPSGQVTSTFANNPQLPFEDAEIHFFGGERAPLATPARCGGYTTNATFEPWTNTASVHEALAASSTFQITSGPNGGPCAGASLPFNPSLSSESTNVNAGSFTPLSTTLSRPTGDQSIGGVTLHYPPGLSGSLTGVELCPEPRANQGTCGPGSQIGETIVSVGVGGDPFTVTGGKAYLTGPYNGSGSCAVAPPGGTSSSGCAPFGLSIVNPAKAGPFNLQEGRPVVVRAKVEVDPHTAALTVTTNPYGTTGSIPTLVEGFALQIQHVNVLIDRPGFTFNPTSCAPTQITGSVQSAEGASAPVAEHFQVANCANLKFEPKISVSTSGKTSKANGASLTYRVSYPSGPIGTYANIKKVKVELPKQLPSRLTTLQKACTQAQFQANPSGCPTPSVIGHAKAVVPNIPVPVEGPVYFVSNGGEAFPNLVMVLQGYGVTIELVGNTFISKTGITSTTFNTVPDNPVTSFEINLPEGPYSALAATSNLCEQTLTMPNEYIAQNGDPYHANLPVSVTGCKPAIYVTGSKVKGGVATLKVQVPAAGRLTVVGRGLAKASKQAGKAGAVTIAVHLTKGEAVFLHGHNGRKLKAKVGLTFKPTKGATLGTSVNVLVG